jgi:glyceraldehyde 3-phosphate dehydrogenase (phosphorylating)
MTNDIAINGYGRIGPNVPCAFMKAGRVHDIEIVAINDLGDAETNARLMRYDTAHERCAGSVAVDDDQLVANGDRLEVFADRNPSFVPRGPVCTENLIRVDGVAESLQAGSST